MVGGSESGPLSKVLLQLSPVSQRQSSQLVNLPAGGELLKDCEEKLLMHGGRLGVIIYMTVTMNSILRQSQ